MPIGGTPDDGSISFDISANTAPLNQALGKAQQQFTRQFKGMGKAAQDFGKKHLPTFGKVVTATLKWRKASADNIKLQEKLNSEIKDLDASIARAYRAMAAADATQIKEIKKQIAGYKELKDAKAAALKASAAKAGRAMAPLKAVDKAAGVAAKEFLSKAAAPFSKLASRDILGAMEAGGEFVGHAIEKSFKGVSATMKVTSKFFGKTVGDWMWKGAKSQWAKGGVKGKAGALAAGAGAGIMKGAGGAMKGMEKAAGAMAAIGPALSASVGVLVQLVKVMLDAESAAKEFNKDLLATSSTAEFLSAKGGDAYGAFNNLEKTVEGIRKAATDASENLAWGINKKTHLEFLGTLTAEGVTLNRIGEDAKAAGLEVGEFSAEMVHVGVAYSRNFGVSLNEIATLQGDMMREMGMSLEGVKDQFSMMQQAATESGIASNKFFAIMRGMSADLSLFNLRLEDAVGTLKLLGKAMSPRNAEAFLKTLTSFYKGQDLQSRIKATLLGGGAGATKQRLQKDVDIRIKSMAREVEQKLGSGKGKDMEDAIKGGPKKMAEFMAKNQKALSAEGMGGLKEAMYDAQRMQSKLTRGGLIDVASALKDASPETTMKQLDAIAKVAGAKDVESLTDVQMLAFQSMSGVSDEQLDQLVKAKAGINQVREDLVAQLKMGFNTLSPEQQEIAKRLGINSNTAEDIARAEKMSNDEVWATLTAEQKAAVQGGMKQIDYAKQQAELTSGLGDKLDAILDALFEYIYSVTKDILDDLNEFIQLVGKWLGKPTKESSSRRERRSTMESLRSRGDPTSMGILKALREPGGLAKLIGEKIDASKGTTESRSKQLETLIRDDLAKKNITGEAADDEIKKQMAGRGLDIVAPEIKNVLENVAHKAGATGGPDAIEPVMAAMKKAGLAGENEQHNALTEQLAAGKDLYTAIRGAQLTPEQITNLTKALASGLDETKLADAATRMDALKVPEKPKGEAAATPPPTEAKPPSAVAEATAASAAPGTGGAPAGAAAAPAPPEAAPAAPKPSAPTVTTAENTTVTADNTAVAAATLVNMDSKQGEIVKGLTGMNPKGVVLGDPKSQFADALEKATLKAMQQALFEYWLYSSSEEDVNAVLKKMVDSKTEITAGNLVEMMNEQAKGGAVATGVKGGGGAGAAPADPNAPPPPNAPPAPPHSGGGYVVDTSGPLARVIRAPAGEAFTAIGKGETITPRGGGSGGGSIKVELSFKGDMDRYVEAKVIDTTYENKRRQRIS